MVHHLRGQAQSTPQRVIFRFPDEDGAHAVLSCAQIDLAARRLAVHLQSLGMTGERAVLMHSPGPDYVLALLGCFYAGVVAVPAYPPRFNRPMERIRDLVMNADARLALTTDAALKRMQPHLEGERGLSQLTWTATDALPEDISADDWRQPDISADSLALLQYTSGSTSSPKGVMITHACFRNNVSSMAQALNATPDDRMVTWLPPYHDMGLVGGLLSALFVGMETVVLAPSVFLQRPLRWLSAIAEHRATISGGPNFGYELCARRITKSQSEQLDLSSWRVAFCGAERVRTDTLLQFARHFSVSGFKPEAFAPCYGLAEATLAVSFSAGGLRYADTDTYQPVSRIETDDATKPLLVSCGQAVPNVHVKVVDTQTLQPVKDGEVGELWVQSNAVAVGYWNKPQLSAEVFRAHLAGDTTTTYLRTGDLGFIQQGELYVLGRLKDLIIIRGVNVYPEDIEALVERIHDGLRPAGAVAFSIDRDDEEQLIVVQELNPGVKDMDFEEVASKIRSVISEVMQLAVQQVILVAPGGVPRTSSGKVQRRRCRELYLAQQLEVVHDSATQSSALAEASAELTSKVAQLMAELLSVEKVTADDDFFWLGGHSLLATQLASRIRNEFAVDLPLSIIFSAATPRRLAAQIASLPASAIRPDIRPIARTGRLPVTFSQERMWLLYQMDPAGTAYNVAGAVLINGALDVAALSRAFSEVVAAHEILRTRYRTIDGEVDVQIVEPLAVELKVVDLSEQDQAVDAALRMATTLARQPFNITSESLLRIALYRTGKSEHVLAVCIHHLVTDAWSMGMMMRDVLYCYDALVAGKPAQLQAPAISYIDYAHWQRQFMSGPQINTQLDYWKQQLQGAEAIELPTDKPRRQHRSSAGELEPLALSAELMDAIGALASAHGVTPFMVMLATFEVLLFRWSGRTDLVVGVPVANRNWQESEQLMGTLVNTLPIRLRFSEQSSFAQLLRDVRQQSLDAYANQDLPFERLIAELHLERKPGSSPLVSVMFDYQNTPMPGRHSGDITMKPLFLSRGSAQFDLSMLILDTDFGRVAGVEYSTDLFSSATIKRFLGHYLMLLEAVILNPEVSIDRLPMMSAAERQSLLAHAQRTCHAQVQLAPLVESIDACCVTHPRRLAVQDANVSLTYAELQQRVQHVSAALITWGVTPGQRVAVCLERGVDLAVALLAVMRCGAAYVPMDPNHPRDRLGYVLEDAQPALLLTQTFVSGMQEMAGTLRVEYLDRLSTTRHIEAMVSPVACDESLAAYVIYTSGSTGRPKGVEVSRRALANFIRSMQHTPGMAMEDRLLSVTTVAFDIAGLELYLPLATGASVYVAGSDVAADGPRLLQLMHDWHATLMQATPATWKMLIEAGWRSSPHLKVLCGGEAFPRELAEQLLQRAGSVWNMYGPTETTIWSSVQRVVPGTDTLVPIGEPIDETTIYILDKHQQLVPQGVPGEIWIGGLGVANGYYHRPELTQERFIADPYMPADMPQHARMYRTGDAGRLRSDGVFEHLGRLDDQIKIRGFRIEPGEIEQVLKEHKGVADTVVLAREVRPGDVRLIAYYVPVDRHVEGIPMSELLEPLRRKLPAYMIPTAFVPMKAFPTTPNNKIDRRALPPPVLDLTASDAEYLPPRDELDTALVEMWQELLNIKRVGIRDNFFMLGGHSLLAVRLFARIEKQLRVQLPLAVLFEHPTIESLAGIISEKQKISVLPEQRKPAIQHKSISSFQYLVPIQREGNKPPLYCVHGAGGNVLNLWALSRYLGEQQPFYGVQAKGIDGLAAPMRDIQQMADAYLQEIRQVQPAGPYYLSGYCAGGWVALEIARRLRAEGEQVALLALLDCYHPALQSKPTPMRNFLAGMNVEGLSYLWRKAPQRIGYYLQEMRRSITIAVHRLLRRPVPIELREYWLTRAMTMASFRYHPAPYEGDVVLMRATDMDPQLRDVGACMGWDDVMKGKIDINDVAGDHHTLAQEPHVVDLASSLHAHMVILSEKFGIALRTGMMQAGKPETFR
ncbi:MAG: amino acid adenylation domain-containing protein [Steroidobacter sp.]